MERIIKKLFLSGCLVLATAISLTALASSSASAVQKTSTFSVTVPRDITLSGTSSTISIDADYTQIKPGDLNATVKSNSSSGFTISLHAATPALTSGSNTIPASNSVTAGTSGWGIKTKPTQNSTNDNSTYTALTNQAVQFYKQTTAQTTAQAYTFKIGVAVAKTQPIGTYTTTVTVTAANI